MPATVEGLGAQIKDGKLVDATSASSIAKKVKNGNTLDKDAFLKLLVTQMKYQDPLEPTSNTEFISQYATFSELEQMQNMGATLELSRASSYVGQTVTVRTTMATGEIREIEGKVDYVIFENGKALLSINGELYSASDVYATVDREYKAAYDLATVFAKAMNSLPNVNNITLDDEEVINNLRDGFNSMSGYQQSFVSKELVEKLQKYVARIEELKGALEAQMVAELKKALGGETDTEAEV